MLPTPVRAASEAIAGIKAELGAQSIKDMGKVMALLKEPNEYTREEAARALGVPNGRIIFRHLLPNAVGPIVVAFTLGIANNIVLEAFVSFLGFGIQPPNYSWGSTLAGAQGVLVAGNWWWITFPGLAVVATVLCINFIGDGLRDALDPKIIR